MAAVDESTGVQSYVPFLLTVSIHRYRKSLGEFVLLITVIDVGIISIFLLVCISVDIAQQTYDTV